MGLWQHCTLFQSLTKRQKVDMKKTNVFSALLLGFTVLAVTPLKSYATDITQLLGQQLKAPFNEEVEMIKVHYAPGESSPPHRHNAHTLVYMLEGRGEVGCFGIRSKPGGASALLGLPMSDLAWGGWARVKVTDC